MTSENSGRDAILDTSAKLFSQHGYNGVAIRDIVEQTRRLQRKEIG
jgi:AcrR family transcriptional regulator